MTRDELTVWLKLFVEEWDTKDFAGEVFTTEWLATEDTTFIETAEPMEVFYRYSDIMTPWGFMVVFHADKEMYAVAVDREAPKRGHFNERFHCYSPDEVFVLITTHLDQEKDHEKQTATKN